MEERECDFKMQNTLRHWWASFNISYRWHHPHFLQLSSVFYGKYTHVLVIRIYYFLEAHVHFVVNTVERWWHRPHFLGISSAFCGDYTRALVRRIQYFLKLNMCFVVNAPSMQVASPTFFWGSYQRFVAITLRRWWDIQYFLDARLQLCFVVG